MCSGVGSFFTGFDVDKGRLGEANRLLVVAFDQPGPCRLNDHSPAQRGRGAIDDGHRTVDVANRLTSTSYPSVAPRPDEQQSRAAVDDGTETREQAKAGSRLDCLDHGFRERRQHLCCTLMFAGV